jgi:hypothetical protein
MDAGVVSGTMHPAPDPVCGESLGHAGRAGASKVPATLRVAAARGRLRRRCSSPMRPGIAFVAAPCIQPRGARNAAHTLFQQPAGSLRRADGSSGSRIDRWRKHAPEPSAFPTRHAPAGRSTQNRPSLRAPRNLSVVPVPPIHARHPHLVRERRRLRGSHLGVTPRWSPAAGPPPRGAPFAKAHHPQLRHATMRLRLRNRATAGTPFPWPCRRVPTREADPPPGG